MQKSLPEVLDFAKETEETKKLYGIDRPETKAFGMQMLASRRLVERGVRFIQVQHGAGGAGVWDAHGGLKANHSKNCLAVDKPIGGPAQGPEAHGLAEGDDRGLRHRVRPHAGHARRATAATTTSSASRSGWPAAGSRAASSTAKTDEIGFHAVENPALRHRRPRDDPAPARPRLPQAGDPRPQAAGHRSRQCDQGDHRVK